MCSSSSSSNSDNNSFILSTPQQYNTACMTNKIEIIYKHCNVILSVVTRETMDPSSWQP